MLFIYKIYILKRKFTDNGKICLEQRAQRRRKRL
jgi:hypothetical protein